MSLQNLRQEVRDEVDFLHVDKHQSWFQHFGHQSFLQGDTIISDWHDQAYQSNKYSMFLQYLKKDVRDGVQFLHADKHQSFYKLVLSLFIKMARHALKYSKKEFGNIFAV